MTRREKIRDYLIVLYMVGNALTFTRVMSLKEKSRNLRAVLVPTLAEKPDVGVARISGVDAVPARPLRRAALLSALEV